MTAPEGARLRTYGDLKALMARERESLREMGAAGNWPSRVNPSMTHTQALDILEAGLRAHPDETLIADSRRGELIARNVQRECRSRRGMTP
jgi:hypothetical protein